LSAVQLGLALSAGYTAAETEKDEDRGDDITEERRMRPVDDSTGATMSESVQIHSLRAARFIY